MSTHDSPELWNKRQPTLFSCGCSAASGRFFPHIHPEEAGTVTSSCHNPLREGVVGCHDQDLGDFIDEVGGLAMDISLKPIPIDIPTYIPVLDKNTTNMREAVAPYEVVGTTLRDIVRGVTTIRAGAEQEVTWGSFKLPMLLNGSFKGKKTILFLSGSDTLIESLWYNRDEYNMINNLRAMGFSAVTGFNFSLIEGECVVAQALNQKKSLFSSHLLEEGGIPSIPHFYATNVHQVDRVIEWLNNNPTVQIFAFNCQLQKTERDIQKTIETLKKIFENVKHPIHVILQGFPFDMIENFGNFLDRIHFADKRPAKEAQFGNAFTLDMESLKLGIIPMNGKMSTEDLLIRNLMYRRIYIELIKQKVLKNYLIPSDILIEIGDMAAA